MRVDLVDQLTSSPHVSLTVGPDTWHVYVFGLTRIAQESFIQVALIGSRFCTATVRVQSRGNREAEAREVIALLRDWLSSGELSVHTFLESARCLSRPS